MCTPGVYARNRVHLIIYLAALGFESLKGKLTLILFVLIRCLNNFYFI